MNKEIEVKFKIKDKEKLLEKLRILDGKEKESIFQKTYSLFMPNYEMVERGVFLRVREDNGRATFAVKVKKIDNDKFYERDEYEIKVPEAEKMVKMISLLGFSKIRIFEKKRQVWELPDKKIGIFIDTLPFAEFIEIEGEKKEIEDMILKLGLGEERITKAYWGVYEDYCKENDLEIKNDILFN